MRIISGTARSRTLLAPKGTDTRPTLDGVRESLFNILRGECSGARVLDLFCGSGALALEALSRGAENAVLCDVSRDAARVARTNVETLGFQASARVMCMDYRMALAALAGEGAQFSLVFLDPPYAMPTAPVCEELLRLDLLCDDALVCVEHALKTPPAPAGFHVCATRAYRDTGLTFLTILEDDR